MRIRGVPHSTTYMVESVWHEIVALEICGVALIVAVVWAWRRIFSSKSRCHDCDKSECPLHTAHKEIKNNR